MTTRDIQFSTGKPAVRLGVRQTCEQEAAPFLGFAVDLVRRFMPDADRPTLIMAAIWLVGQCNVFIRHREQLAMPPVSLNLDEPGVDRLSALISEWALAGLAPQTSTARGPASR